MDPRKKFARRVTTDVRPSSFDAAESGSGKPSGAVVALMVLARCLLSGPERPLLCGSTPVSPGVEARLGVNAPLVTLVARRQS